MSELTSKQPRSNYMNTQPDEQALMRANILGFSVQVKHATGAADEKLPDMYKRASSLQNAVMTKRANLRDLVLAQFAPKAA